MMQDAYATPPRLTQTESYHPHLSTHLPDFSQPLHRDAPPQRPLSQQPRFTYRRKAIPGYHSGSSHHYHEIDSPSCRVSKQVVGYEKLEESEKEAERRWKKQAGRLKGQSSLCLLYAECLSILPIMSPYDNTPSHVSACEAVLYSDRTRKPCNSPTKDEYEKASSTCKSSYSALTPPPTGSLCPFRSIERSQGNISYGENAYDPSGSPFSTVPAPPQNDHWLLDLTQSIEQPGRWDVRPENAGSMPSGSIALKRRLALRSRPLLHRLTKWNSSLHCCEGHCSRLPVVKRANVRCSVKQPEWNYQTTAGSPQRCRLHRRTPFDSLMNKVDSNTRPASPYICDEVATPRRSTLPSLPPHIYRILSRLWPRSTA